MAKRENLKHVKLESTENPDVERRTSEGNLTCQTEVSPVSVIHQAYEVEAIAPSFIEKPTLQQS